MKYIVFLVMTLALSGCRKDTPPAIEICIMDGFGGADCQEADGSKVYKLPSEMKNYWSTNQVDMKSFASWCYETPQ